jgi:hypothetical protein
LLLCGTRSSTQGSTTWAASPILINSNFFSFSFSLSSSCLLFWDRVSLWYSPSRPQAWGRRAGITAWTSTPSALVTFLMEKSHREANL